MDIEGTNTFLKLIKQNRNLTVDNEQLPQDLGALFQRGYLSQSKLKTESSIEILEGEALKVENHHDPILLSFLEQAMKILFIVFVKVIHAFLPSLLNQIHKFPFAKFLHKYCKIPKHIQKFSKLPDSNKFKGE